MSDLITFSIAHTPLFLYSHDLRPCRDTVERRGEDLPVISMNRMFVRVLHPSLLKESVKIEC